MSSISDKLEKVKDIDSEMFKSKLWGLEIEVRSPNLKERTRIVVDGSDENGKMIKDLFSTMLLIGTCFVPGTDDPAFDESHVDMLNSKNGKEMQRLLVVCIRLAGFDGEVEAKNG